MAWELPRSRSNSGSAGRACIGYWKVNRPKRSGLPHETALTPQHLRDIHQRAAFVYQYSSLLINAGGWGRGSDLWGLGLVAEVTVVSPDDISPSPTLASVASAERGFQQASRVALAKPCRRDNSVGDAFPHHLRLTGVLKLFIGGVEQQAPRSCGIPLRGCAHSATQVAHVQLWNYARRAIAQVNSGKKGYKIGLGKPLQNGIFLHPVLSQRFSKDFRGNNDEGCHLREGEHG